MYLLRLWVKRILSNMRMRLLGAHASAIIYDTEAGVFALSAHDFTIGRRLGHKGVYQIDEYDTLVDLCKKYNLQSACFVGSHVGYFVIQLSRHLSHVYAVEPNPASLKWLRLNIELNHRDNIKIYPFAATDSDTELSFWPSTENTGGSKIALVRTPAQAVYDKGKPICVEGKKLDPEGIMADLLVIDIEGHEVPALRGMETMLGHARVVTCEVIPALSEAAGYKVEEQINLLVPHFNLFYVDDINSQSFDKNSILRYFMTLKGDNRWISRNLICLKS